MNRMDEAEDEASSGSPHEQLEGCLKNLFEVPSRNIESAFELVLGLIKEQSLQIDGLKRAHDEALVNNEKIRTSLQSAVETLAKDKNVLSLDFHELKLEHEKLLQSHHDTTTHFDELKNEVEVSEVLDQSTACVVICVRLTNSRTIIRL